MNAHICMDLNHSGFSCRLDKDCSAAEAWYTQHEKDAYVPFKPFMCSILVLSI